MITSKISKLFISYNGNVNSFQHGKKRERKDMEDADFYFLTNLIQNFILMKNKKASIEFKNEVKEKLKVNCDGEDTVRAFKEFVYGRP